MHNVIKILDPLPPLFPIERPQNLEDKGVPFYDIDLNTGFLMVSHHLRRFIEKNKKILLSVFCNKDEVAGLTQEEAIIKFASFLTILRRGKLEKIKKRIEGYEFFDYFPYDREVNYAIWFLRKKQ